MPSRPRSGWKHPQRLRAERCRQMFSDRRQRAGAAAKLFLTDNGRRVRQKQGRQMAIRLQELHPSLVHFPIALLPASLAADAVGRFTGDEGLMDTGRRLMPAAAASAVLAGAAGLVAQGAVRAEGRAHRQLTTHRNLNIGLVALTVLLAGVRARRSQPSLAYLLAGAAGVATAAYTAYLGGRMVYEHGVGVKAAGALHEDAAPELRPRNLARSAQLSAHHLKHAVRHTAEHAAKGEVIPELRHD